MLAAVCDVIKMAGGYTRSQGTRVIIVTQSLQVVCHRNIPQATQCKGIDSFLVSCHQSVPLLMVSYGSSQRPKLDPLLLQRVISSCCQQPSYTIFPGPLTIVNRTCHTSGPGKACLRLTTSIFCWTASHWHLSIG